MQSTKCWTTHKPLLIQEDILPFTPTILYMSNFRRSLLRPLSSFSITLVLNFTLFTLIYRVSYSRDEIPKEFFLNDDTLVHIISSMWLCPPISLPYYSYPQWASPDSGFGVITSMFSYKKNLLIPNIIPVKNIKWYFLFKNKHQSYLWACILQLTFKYCELITGYEATKQTQTLLINEFCK